MSQVILAFFHLPTESLTVPKPVDSSTPIACSTPDIVASPAWHADPADAATVSDN